MSEETLFNEALAKSSAERAAFLDAACVGQPQLRAAVEALLAAHERSGNLLDEPPVALGQTVDSEPGPARPLVTGEYTPDPAAASPQVVTSDYHPNVEPGAVIAGRYTLQEKIGEGGMGDVWVAKQTEPVKRKVALKLIKTGMDTKAVLQRFDAERQALAMMDHSNIARVYDGGMTADRRPFFVMELVNGLPLTKFCDQAKLGIRERLDLFAAICQAVQHAHQKGIIHRDLKPSNILVTLIDARPVPKVIDFGVAKAIGGKLLDESLSTQFGAVVGTLEYMSPEQAGFSGSDIDTRADIYSLGVILYELLTGLRPIDARRLKKAAYTEMIRIIQEDEPSKPSTRLSTDQSLPSLAASRQTEPKKLMALLRGELDWVVMKCLEKDRARRYETANALSRDIQRYLADEVVEARAPSAGYRLQKFVKRNKGQVIAASLLLLALLAGITGTTIGLFEAKKQEQLATAAATEERKAKDREAERAEGERKARLDAQANEKLAGERLVQVEAEKKKAEQEKQIAQAVKDFLQNKLLAQTDTRTQADALLKGGGAASEAKFNPTIRELLDRAARELAPDKIEQSFAKQPLVQAEILATVGSTYRDIGEYPLAIDFLKRAEALFRQHLGPDNPDTLTSMNNLASAYQAAGKLDLALPLLEDTLTLRKAKLGPEHPDTLTSIGTLASAYQAAGKRDLALPLFQESLKLCKAKLGPEHPDTLTGMNNLAGAYRDAGKRDLALPLFEETLKRTKAKLGPEHPDTLTSMSNLAAAYWSAMQLDKSIPLFEETLKLQDAKLGRNHPNTLATMANLGVNYRDAGRLKEAIPLLEEAYQASKKHVSLRGVSAPLLDAYLKAGENAKFTGLLKDQLAHGRRTLPKDSPQLAGMLAQIGSVLLEQKTSADAEPLLRECLAIREKKEPEDWRTFNTKSMLGGALLGPKKYAEAEPLLLAGYEGMKKRAAKIPAQGKIRLTEAVERLVQLYEAMDKKDDGAKWRKELEAIKAAQKRVEKKP